MGATGYRLLCCYSILALGVAASACSHEPAGNQGPGDPGGSGGGGGDPGGSGGGPGGGPPGQFRRPATAESHFDAWAEWPATDYHFDDWGKEVGEFLGGRNWFFKDLDGDGLKDLVFTGERTIVFGSADDRHFDFWRNTGAGFAEAVPWPVPGDVSTSRYATGDGHCAGETQWFLAPVEGTGRPDLVVQYVGSGTGDACSAQFPGEGPSVRVHGNTGSGFLREGVVRSMPEGAQPVRIVPPERAWTEYPSNETRPRLFDIDGDGRADWVAAGDPEGGGVLGRGDAPHWKVSRGTADGWAAAERWPVPSSVAALQGYDETGDTCRGECWGLRDLDGDGRRDLIVTGEETGPGSRQPLGGPEQPHWLVYPNTGTGFGEAIEVPLPDFSESYRTNAFAELLPNEGYLYSLLDLDGDRDLDLVVTWTGFELDPYWAFHENLGNRFALDPVAWTLPADPVGIQRFAHASAQSWGTAGVLVNGEFVPVFKGGRLTLDLDGDRRPDFLHWEFWAADNHMTGAPDNPYFRFYKNR